MSKTTQFQFPTQPSLADRVNGAWGVGPCANRLNPDHSASFKFPAIKPQSWSKVFKNKAGDKAIDLISKWLRYKPLERLSPLGRWRTRSSTSCASRD